MKYLYTNAHSIGNKQEELQIMVELEIDLIAIIGTWWDESLSWNTTIESYRPRRDKLGRRRRGVSLYLKE